MTEIDKSFMFYYAKLPERDRELLYEIALSMCVINAKEQNNRIEIKMNSAELQSLDDLTGEQLPERTRCGDTCGHWKPIKI